MSLLTKSGVNVVLEWIPSHVGIYGNECADLQAKKALDLENINTVTPYYKEDIKTLCKSFLKGMWQKSWLKNKHGRHLFDIEPEVSFAISVPKMNREKEVILYKLRTGYAKLNKHLKKIGMKETDTCELCTLNTEDSVYHFLIECPKYNDNRRIMFKQLQARGVNNFSLQNLLSGNCVQPIIDFVHSSQRHI